MKTLCIKGTEPMASRPTTEESSVVQRFIRVVSLFFSVIPAKAGIYSNMAYSKKLDSVFTG